MRDTLLIIDDSELDLAILNEIFKHLFRVECVLDYRRGLSFLHQREERVCAILLDICLEKRGAGFTVLNQLQSDPKTARLPVILITTDANERDVRASVEKGAVDFLVKPVDPHTVQERVCDVVRAAWPPQSTILDGKTEGASGQEPPAKTKAMSFFPQGLSLEETQRFCREWLQKLEVLCRLRPVLSLETCRQVGTITSLLAERYRQDHPQCGLTQEDAVLMGLAAAFCDIGLLALPSRVAEAGEEQEEAGVQLYYQHTRLGWELLHWEGENAPLLRYAEEIALWHHKNVDGSGYPWNASGDAIPLSARLTRVALRIQRYLRYYQGCSDTDARMLRALKSESGTMLDPAVCQTVEQGGETFWAALRTG